MKALSNRFFVTSLGEPTIRRTFLESFGNLDQGRLANIVIKRSPKFTGDPGIQKKSAA